MTAAVENRSLEQLAIFGGERLFATPKSTSNLVPPDFARFLAYAEPLLETQDGEAEIVELMQHRFAAFHDASHCIAFSNGFWALASAIKALALPGRSEIVMPSLTYRRMADIAAWAQLKPRFCEVDAHSLAASPATVEPCLGRDTALVLGVHPIVNCCDAAGLTELARRHGLPILFDSVESVYERVAGRKVGSFGDAECFSLHASKLINGFEGGYVTTNDARLARRLAMARDLGRDATGAVAVSWGLNARLSGLHAAMALAGLDGLAAQVTKNRNIYDAYRRTLNPVGGVRLVAFETAPTSFKNILIELTAEWPLTRADTIAILNSEGALARAYYYPPLHRKKMSYAHVPADLPATDALAERFVLMPCGHFVDERDIERIAALLGFVAANAVGIAARLAAREAA
jgi:dTDP-4-amino-4,6-dideoxygalactose transaminase